MTEQRFRGSYPSREEAVIAFEQFQDSKTALNIAKWLKTSHTKAGLKPEYIMCHATDGASNAVGSSLEFQAMTDAATTKADSIRHYCTMPKRQAVVIFPEVNFEL
jgi:glycerate kinase